MPCPMPSRPSTMLYRSGLPDLRQEIQSVLGSMSSKERMSQVLFVGMLAIGADAREDVVRSMTRCAAYTEDRQWLECYYGAAQPMRAWLGLPPAPQSQLK